MGFYSAPQANEGEEKREEDCSNRGHMKLGFRLLIGGPVGLFFVGCYLWFFISRQ